MNDQEIYGLHPDQIVLDAEARESGRSRVAQGTYRAKRARALVDPGAHPLRKARLTFGVNGGGLTISELSSRSTVAESVIQDIESNNAQATDRTWERLSRALGLPRHHLDPRNVYCP